MGEESPLILQDLAENYSASMLRRFYHDVYLPAFPILDEREDLDVWQSLLTPKDRTMPETHIIIGKYGEKNGQTTIAGGIVEEYYRRSQVGLISYLVISPEFRGRGLAQHFMQAGIKASDRASERLTPGGKPCAYLAEANDPACPESHNDSQDPHMRLMLLSRLGFHLAEMPYVQPRLAGRENRYYGLRLLAHEATWRANEPTTTGAGIEATIDSGILKMFLEEFYTAVEGKPSPSDGDYAAMISFLDATPHVRCVPISGE